MKNRYWTLVLISLGGLAAWGAAGYPVESGDD